MTSYSLQAQLTQVQTLQGSSGLRRPLRDHFENHFLGLSRQTWIQQAMRQTVMSVQK